MPRRVASGVCFHPAGWAVRRRAESPTHPPPALGQESLQGQGHYQNVRSQPPTGPPQLSGSRPPRTSPVRTSHYKAFSAAPPPCHQTHVCTQGSSTLCPWSPGTGGRAASATRAQCCVRSSHAAVMATCSSDLVPGGHRHTPCPSHPTPPRFPGPSLPPCLVVKTLTPRAGPADTWSPSQKHGTYFSD